MSTRIPAIRLAQITKSAGRTMKPAISSRDSAYSGLVSGLGGLLEAARRATVHTVHTLMTATYWEFGRRIVEFEQGGSKRAAYGEELLRTLSTDLSSHFF